MVLLKLPATAPISHGGRNLDVGHLQRDFRQVGRGPDRAAEAGRVAGGEQLLGVRAGRRELGGWGLGGGAGSGDPRTTAARAHQRCAIRLATLRRTTIEGDLTYLPPVVTTTLKPPW